MLEVLGLGDIDRSRAIQSYLDTVSAGRQSRWKIEIAG